MSIVHARPFYKRMGLDVIKSLWIGYMPQLTSTRGLRGNKFYLAEMDNRIVRLYVTMACLL